MKEPVKVEFVNRKQVSVPKLAFVDFDAIKISRKVTRIQNCIFLNFVDRKFCHKSENLQKCQTIPKPSPTQHIKRIDNFEREFYGEHRPSAFRNYKPKNPKYKTIIGCFPAIIDHIIVA